MIYECNIHLFILKSPKGKIRWDVLKQFSSQIGVAYLGRVWVLDPPTDVGMEIKYLNPMWMGLEIINGDGE